MGSVLAMLVACWAGPAWAATVARVAVESGRVAVRFSEGVAAARGTLLPGGRIAIDVPGAAPGGDRRAGALVSAIGERARGAGTRIVLTLAAPAVIADGGFDADGQRLTLTLRRASGAEVAQAAPLDFFPFNLGGMGSRSGYKLVQAVPPPARAAPLPSVQGAAGRPLVVIDPGHGGIDPGAVNPVTGLREKDVTLKIAEAIRDDLVASGRVRVALTREDDRFLVLRDRFGIARRLHADLFISIHCDSTLDNGATGASVYTLSEVASDKEAARLAARENKADVIAGVDLGDANADVSSILIDLTQRETMNASAGFARLLGREAQPLMPLKANFHRMASLMVLKAPDMPSVLFETGYISNPVDAAFLDSAEGRARIAESVTHAVEAHFARRLASR